MFRVVQLYFDESGKKLYVYTEAVFSVCIPQNLTSIQYLPKQIN